MDLPIFGAKRAGRGGAGRRRRRPTAATPRAPVEVLEIRTLLSTTFTVLDTFDDDAPGSLRWAIGRVNADATDTSATPDTIAFAVPATDPGFDAEAGTWTISPASALPTITRPVVIDGDSQPGSSPNTLAQGDNATIAIHLDGAKAGASVDGLAISGGSSLVRGLAITDFTDGIHLEGAGGDSISGDFLGVDPDGTTADGNGSVGILIDGAPAVTIGGASAGDRLLIADNGRGTGPYVDAGGGVLVNNSPDDVFQGSYYGTDRSGAARLGYTATDLQLSSSPGATVGGPSAGSGNVLGGAGSDGHGVSTDSSALVQDNLVGVDPTGTIAVGNGSGVVVSDGSQVLGNVISGNAGSGIDLRGEGILVQGNEIGTDVSGTKAIPNGEGIFSGDGRNTIGGTSPGLGNVISGNSGYGLIFTSELTGYNLIQGNKIGTDATGTKALGNGSNGIYMIEETSNTIGGSSPGAGNVISGNAANGIDLTDSDFNVVQGNEIGTDYSGTRPLPNGQDGINLSGALNTIGGTTAAANVIAGNGRAGILMEGQSGSGRNLIEGDYIGTDASGFPALGNGGNGLTISNPGNSIGGSPAAADVIADNGGAGVALVADPNYGNPTGVSILFDSIHDNAGLGIDLGGDGVTPNGPSHGPNAGQPYPVLRAVASFDGQTYIEGALDSAADAPFTIQFFSSPSADPSGHGEGRTYLGQTTVTTDDSGVASFLAVLPGAASGLASATATNSLFDTSEFSNDLPIGAATTPVFAADDSYKDDVDTALTVAAPGVLGNDLDVHGGGPLRASLVSGPLHGRLQLNADGSFTYAPGPEFLGTDSFTYEDTLGSQTSNVATSTITIYATTFAVTNTNDSGPGSLRQAILDLNQAESPTPDLIAFSIPGGPGPFTIVPTSPLPAIAWPVVLDGDTESSASPNDLATGDDAVLRVHLSGASLGGTVDGLAVAGGDSLIRGLSITGFRDGIHLEGAADDEVAGDFLGVDPDGTTADGNTSAGVFLDGVSGVTIGGTGPGDRDLLSDNGLYADVGEEVMGSNSPGAQFLGSYYGTDRSGTARLGQSNMAIRLTASPDASIGGPAAGSGNLISGAFNAAVMTDAAGLIQGNLFGTDPTGTKVLDGDTGSGVVAQGGMVILDNVISEGKSGGTGITLYANKNIIQGNRIGTDIGGTKPLGNGGDGLRLEGAFDLIGGTAPGQGNVISANLMDGISMDAEGATDDVIQGNEIGTDVSGMIALGNGGSGIQDFFSSTNTIGGTVVGAGNIISGNLADGLLFHETGANLIEGNIIGLNRDQTAALGNADDGLDAVGGYDEAGNEDTIGGTVAGSGNVISGNGRNGLVLGDPSQYRPTLVQGNFLGTDSSGARAFGNAVDGILIQGEDSTSTYRGPGNQIGGSRDSANVIAYNGGAGVLVEPGPQDDNSILSNSIHDNAKLGIDLGGDGVTPNTPGGPHQGANDLQNYPVLIGAATSADSSTIFGTLNSAASAAFLVQFFADPLPDPSGFGQGRTYLGQISVMTDPDGDASFSFVAPGDLRGRFFTATATDPDGNTSEFARDVQKGTLLVADLSASAAPPSGTVAIGGTISDVFTITNRGPDPASGVVATDDLPPSLADASAAASMGDLSIVGGRLTVLVPDLPAGASFTVTVSGTATALGAVVDTLSAASPVADPDPTDDSATASTTVTAAPTTTSLAASPNPSSLGQAVTLTATVSGNSPRGGPSGSVAFSVDGQEVAAVPVVASADGLSASASFVLSGLGVGGHQISASYGGDADLAPSTSAAIAQEVARAATTTTLAASPEAPTVGQPVTITASVTGPASPGGAVTFSVDGSAVATVPLVEAPGGSSATASLTDPSLPAGPHTITAAYGGDSTSTPSASSASVDVGRAAASTAFSASPDPAEAGAPVTLSASVSGPVGPSGTVTFYDGLAPIATAPLGPGGRAAVVVSTLSPGSHTLSAIFGGDASLRAAASAPVVLLVAAPSTPPAIGSPAPEAPTVSGVARYGFHAEPTTLVVTFSEAVDPARATDPANYRITDPGGRPIGLASVKLASDGRTVLLTPRRLLDVHRAYRLTVVGTPPGGIAGPSGLPLAGSGAPGTDFSTAITRKTLVRLRPAIHGPARPAPGHLDAARARGKRKGR